MAAKFPRFIVTVDGQQAGMAWSHDEAWFQSLALWRPGRVVRCEPTLVSAAEAVPGEQEASPSAATPAEA